MDNAQTMSNVVRLPSEIKVKIFQGKSGKWIVELPQFDLFAQADSPLEFDFLINDLMYISFDVPKGLQKYIRYVAKKPAERAGLKDLLMFQKFISSEASSAFINSPFNE